MAHRTMHGHEEAPNQLKSRKTRLRRGKIERARKVGRKR